MSVDPRTTVWGYSPSLAGNAIFIAIFVLLTGAHIYMRWRYKAPAAFFNPLIAGGIFEIIGYSARVGARGSLTSIPAYAIQAIFLLLPPVLFAATCYMTLGRNIYAVDAQHLSRIPLRWLTKTFVICDIVCFALQAAGGGLQSAGGDSDQLPEIGKWVVVAGLILQIVTFGFYTALAVDFHRRLTRRPTPKAYDSGIPWLRVMQVIYASSVLIILRNLVRVVEYVQGFHGWIIRHEFMLFVFDGVLMALLLIALLVFHPARLLDGHLECYKVDVKNKKGSKEMGEGSDVEMGA